MSARETISDSLVAFLEGAKTKEGHTFFDAPYGILPGLENFGKGKLRVIAFGVSRYLDACIKIYSPNRIVVTGQGGLTYKVDGLFSSMEDLKAAYRESFDYVIFPD